MAGIKSALIGNSLFKDLLFRYFGSLFDSQYPQGNENSNWQELVSRNCSLMNTKSTFHAAALDYLSRITVKIVSFIIFKLEQDGMVEAFLNSNHSLGMEELLGCFDHLFTTNYQHQLKG